MKSDVNRIYGLNVLLIDDDCLQQDIIRRLYARNGACCDCCSNLQELVELIRKHTYDLILTDMRMPEVDGYQVLTLLRQCNIGQSKTIPVLVVSACTDESIDTFIEAGFAGCLYKPFSESELISTTANCIKDYNYTFTTDFTAIMDGEDDWRGMLDLFIEETSEKIVRLKSALASKDYGEISMIVHKSASLWEMLQINIPVEVLRQLASLPINKWDTFTHQKVETIIRFMEQIVKVANQYRDKLP